METANTSRPLTVLVVDKDPEARASLCHMVGEEYPVLAAFDTSNALRVAHASRPDVIVLSVEPQPTPAERGRLRDLLRDRALSDTPVLLLGNSNGRHRRSARTRPASRPLRRAAVMLRSKHEGLWQVREDLHPMKPGAAVNYATA